LGGEDPVRHSGATRRFGGRILNVLLRNPRRTIEIQGARTVLSLLDELGLNREAHLVIRNGTLVPGDGRLDDSDSIEIRPVISGGSR
jgi:sulfur carrier protein